MKNYNRKAFMYCEHLVISHHDTHYSVSTTTIKIIKFKRYLYFKLSCLNYLE